MVILLYWPTSTILEEMLKVEEKRKNQEVSFASSPTQDKHVTMEDGLQPGVCRRVQMVYGQISKGKKNCFWGPEWSRVLTLPLLARESPQSAGSVRLLDFFSSWSPASSMMGSSLVCMNRHRAEVSQPQTNTQTQTSLTGTHLILDIFVWQRNP